MIAKLKLFSPLASVTNSSPQSVSENLYRQNMELAVKNKTLLLLRQLYEVSIQTLEIDSLCTQVSARIQSALSFELVGIWLWHSGQDHLKLSGFSTSDRLTASLLKCGINLVGLKLDRPALINLYGPVLKENLPASAEGLRGVFGPLVTAEDALTLENTTKTKTSLAYPLVIEQRVIAVLVISLNRSYGELNQYEKESIVSIINVISVALEKTLIYQQLRVANEKLKVLDKQKTEFVSIASHQLRSPLTAIKGYSSMVLEGSFGEINDKVREAVGRVFQSSQKLVNVIEDFLNISRIELGTMKYDISDFDLRETAEMIVKEMRPTVEKSGLKLHFDYDTNLKYMIRGDSGKLSQVVNNLIDNGLKYTKIGIISVRLEKKGGKVRLYVKDTGVGIDEATMPRLFQKFSRADDASKVNIKGTGLGLFVAKQIVEAHKGKIWAESDGVGKGSTFIVEI